MAKTADLKSRSHSLRLRLSWALNFVPSSRKSTFSSDAVPDSATPDPSCSAPTLKADSCTADVCFSTFGY